jgi:hypothetical protein
MLGVQVEGWNGKTIRTTRVCFSPVSGRCIIMNFPVPNVDLVAQVMPALADSSKDGQPASEEVDTWVRVSKRGGISFYRRRPHGKIVERSRELPRKALPSWAADYVASVTFQVNNLSAPIDVTVSGASFDLPTDVDVVGQEPDTELDVAWSIQGHVQACDAEAGNMGNDFKIP